MPLKGEKEENDDIVVAFSFMMDDKSSNESVPFVSRIIKYLV